MTTDFTFTWEGTADGAPPPPLDIVRFTGEEAISAPYRYDLTLLLRAPAPPLDPEELVNRRAALRIATLTEPAYKHLHGILVEAEELHAVPEGLLYRAALMPAMVRARHRTRCRIFLDKTLRQIIDALLQQDLRLLRDDLAGGNAGEPGDPRARTPPEERYAWRLRDLTRIDDPAARPYCVQYNESDLDFLSRLLEAEGIAYHVEQTADRWVLVLSDADEGKARVDPFVPLGPCRLGREVTDLRLGARLRATGVRLRDFDWRRPTLDASASAGGAAGLVLERWPGAFAEAPALGEPLARAHLERLGTEARYATARGACRLLAAGSIVAIDDEGERHDGEYLVTRIEVRAEQGGVTSVATGGASSPWEARFELARRGQGTAVAPSRFRPPRVTQAPRIAGSQTAFVTAEPAAAGAEIDVGGPPGMEIGCVRLRFHWDQDAERRSREPSSCWVRVSQMAAGAGQGALWHPRVGCEVIVEFLDGDPDRPIVTGRVYNGQQRPAAPALGAATVSAWRSCASPGGAVYNELAFEDAAGREELRLHAGRDLRAYAANDRRERVGNDGRSEVGARRSEVTGGVRDTAVAGDNTEVVGGDEVIRVGGMRGLVVGGALDAQVGGARTVRVGADDVEAVSGKQVIAVGGAREVSVGASQRQAVGGDVTREAGGSVCEAASGSLVLTASGEAAMEAGSDLLLLSGATAGLQGAQVMVSASGEIVLSAGGSAVRISGAGVEITGGAIKMAGGEVDVAGGVVKIN